VITGNWEITVGQLDELSIALASRSTTDCAA